MKINEKRLLKNLHTLKTFTDTPGEGVTRFSYGAQDVKARKYILERAKKAGCTVSIDSLQNIKLSLKSNIPGRKTIIAGSHIDTVRNGGWLDGIYGVCSALEVMETLSEADAKTTDSFKYNYNMIIFAEEEGSVFGSTMTGSKFISGIYKDPDLDKLKSDNGKTLRETLRSLSDSEVYNTSPISTKNIIWDFENIKTMLELHIEQGPVLDRENLSLGIVDAIFGMRVIEVTLTGIGNHAGATPMEERYDAMCAAAECILKSEEIVKNDKDKRTVVTVGKLEILPNCSNVIPETVKFTIEVRDKDENKIDRFVDEIIDLINTVADKRRIYCSIKEHSRSTPLPLAKRLINSMSQKAKEQNLSFKVMDSGAVHDACMIAKYADTGMIFVPSIDGRSHVPEENTNEKDLILGCQFLMDTVLDELK